MFPENSTGFCNCISQLNKSITTFTNLYSKHITAATAKSLPKQKKKSSLKNCKSQQCLDQRMEERMLHFISINSNGKMTREQIPSESQLSNMILCNSEEELLRKPSLRNTQHKNLHVDEFRSFQLRQQAFLSGSVSREKEHRILNQEQSLKYSDCNCSTGASLFTAFT